VDERVVGCGGEGDAKCACDVRWLSSREKKEQSSVQCAQISGASNHQPAKMPYKPHDGQMAAGGITSALARIGIPRCLKRRAQRTGPTNRVSAGRCNLEILVPPFLAPSFAMRWGRITVNAAVASLGQIVIMTLVIFSRQSVSRVLFFAVCNVITCGIRSQLCSRVSVIRTFFGIA
jgi:hypothetical protein